MWCDCRTSIQSQYIQYINHQISWTYSSASLTISDRKGVLVGFHGKVQSEQVTLILNIFLLFTWSSRVQILSPEINELWQLRMCVINSSISPHSLSLSIWYYVISHVWNVAEWLLGEGKWARKEWGKWNGTHLPVYNFSPSYYGLITSYRFSMTLLCTGFLSMKGFFIFIQTSNM